jgi:hypothetical protein
VKLSRFGCLFPGDVPESRHFACVERHAREFVAQDEFNPGDLTDAVVEVAYHRLRTGRCAGRAVVGSLRRGTPWMRLARPHPGHALLDTVDLAYTIAHELAHLRGLNHRAMRGPRYRRVPGYRDRYAWASSYVIRARRLH